MLNCSNLNLVGLPSDFVPKLMRASSIDCMDMTLLLVQLNLSNNKFTVIPGEISETATLQILDMSSNLLGQSHPRDIAHSLRSFPAGLQVLNVSKNGLSSEHVDELISIAAVSATIPYTEQQKRIPSTGAPCGIKSILCSQNRLNELPQRLRLLSSSLRELQVSFNFLTSLSGTDFNEFKSLEVFDGSNNKLKSLGNLHKALNLSDVLLSNNDIMDIPLEFGRLKKLRNFSVLGNPQKTVRLNVIQQGTDAIMKVRVGNPIN